MYPIKKVYMQMFALMWHPLPPVSICSHFDGPPLHFEFPHRLIATEHYKVDLYLYGLLIEIELPFYRGKESLAKGINSNNQYNQK